MFVAKKIFNLHRGEQVRFYPPHQRNYEGYCQARIQPPNVERVQSILESGDHRGRPLLKMRRLCCPSPTIRVAGQMPKAFTLQTVFLQMRPFSCCRFQRAALEGAPFSRMLLVQLPDSDEFRQTREKLESHWQQTQQQWQQQWQQQQQQQWQQQWQQQHWQQQQWQQQQWQQQQWQRQQLQQGNQQLCQQQQCRHQQNNTPMQPFQQMQHSMQAQTTSPVAG